MQGQLDTALSARGRWQAERVGEALADAGLEAIVASDLQRAADTARAMGRWSGLAVATDVALRERSFGIFQGSTYAEIDARWPVDAARWRAHDPEFGPAGGETFRAFSARAVAACARIAADHAGKSIGHRHARRRPRCALSRRLPHRPRRTPDMGAGQRDRQPPSLHAGWLQPGRLERHAASRRRHAAGRHRRRPGRRRRSCRRRGHRRLSWPRRLA